MELPVVVRAGRGRIAAHRGEAGRAPLKAHDLEVIA
jgi:hypothetical protein